MQIQPQFMTLNQLLNGRLFKIPEYQRAYSWGRKQRDDLFSDITKLRTNDRGHFLATMVGLRRKSVRIAADAFTELEIVDGQQRLTTITILLRAIEKRLRTDEGGTSSKLASDLQSLLVKGDNLNVLLLQTNHDSSHIFVDYLREGSSGSSELVQTSADQNLVDAIAQCEAFVATWPDPVELLAIVRNQLSVIFHEIEDEALVYTVFEVLNSRGLDVTWFDKVKAMLMAVVFEHGDNGGKRETIDELHRIWRDVYAVIGTRQSLNRETLRFAATLKASTKPSRTLSEEDAAQELTTECGTSSAKAVELSKWLLRVCQAETKLLENHRLRAVTQVVQARLAAIAIMLRGLSAADEKKALASWENITFRVYGLGGRDARTAVGDYVRLAWRIINEKLSTDEIVSELRQLGAKLVSLEDAIGSLRASDVYPSRAEVIRYFLFRYDEFLAKEAGHSINQSQWNKIWADEPARSIEHIKPQSSNVSYIHHLGNLTMLPPGVNSKFRAKEPKEKATEYKTCGLVGTSKLGAQIEADGWTAESVKQREAQFFSWAAREWKD